MQNTLTIELVQAAIFILKEKKQEITLINLRKEIGFGSFSTIKKYLDIITTDALTQSSLNSKQNNSVNENNLDRQVQDKLNAAIKTIYIDFFENFIKKEQKLKADIEAYKEMSQCDEKLKRELYDKIDILEQEKKNLVQAQETEREAFKVSINEQFFNFLKETERLKAQIVELTTKLKKLEEINSKLDSENIQLTTKLNNLNKGNTYE